MSVPLWTSAELAAALGVPADGTFRVDGLNFDTRDCTSGDLFLALQGVRDGHDFVGDAAVKGVAAALVSRRVDVDIPQLVVPDVLQGLRDLAVAARVRAARRIAVTGSVGKTSVTQAILQALQLAGSAHGSIKSFNNHIGAPLTVARTPHGTDAAVFELGMNHAGEIEPLARLVAPHVAVITTVAPVHIEHFSTVEAIADEKAAIFAGLQPGGVAVIPNDNPHAARLIDHATRLGARVRTFGATGDAAIRTVQDIPGGIAVAATLDGRSIDFTVGVAGAHWAGNGLAVLLALDAIGVDLRHGVDALARYRPLRGRGAISVLKLPQGHVTLIDDSYNANPASMRASLAALAKHSGRRIAVLTDMLELGTHAEAEHAALAAPIADAGVTTVYAAGPAMRGLFDALPKSRQALWTLDVVALAHTLVRDLRDGDVVLVKGSNGSKAGQIVTALEGAVHIGAK